MKMNKHQTADIQTVNVRKKFNDLLDTFNQSLFLEDTLIELEGHSYGEVGLLSLLTILNNGNMLLKGEYGSGKTTAFERLSALVFGVPLEFLQHVEIHGNPDMSEDKIKAQLDFGELQSGKEIVRWKYPVFSPMVMIDEINRLPSKFQNMILNEVDRSIWSYRMEDMFSENQTFFATMNRAGPGTSPLTPALLERFDISARTLVPLSLEHRRIMREKVSETEEILKDESISKEILAFMKKTQDKQEIYTYIREKGETFKQKIESKFKSIGFNLELPKAKDLNYAQQKIKDIEFNLPANLFLDYFKANINTCIKGKADNFSSCPYCDLERFPCSKIRYFSNRGEESIVNYSKSLAWLVGKEEVDVEILEWLLPYVLTHRVEVREAELEEREYENFAYWRSKKFKLVKEVVTNDLNRFRDNFQTIRDISKAYYEGKNLPKTYPSPWFELLKRSK